MHQLNDNYILRKPEPKDIEALYVQKNNAEVVSLLGGFNNGYTRQDLANWVDFHRGCKDEILWIIAEKQTDACVGHVGLYKIDHRVRCADFAIMIGDKSAWGEGLGTDCTKFALDYGFNELNLNRITLTVLQTNPRAISLYRKIGFKDEGVLRQAMYKGGRYIDLILMGILRNEYLSDE